MSSGGESDDEYVPREPEQLSEVSTDEETDLQQIKEHNKTNKRKSQQSKKGKKMFKSKKASKEIDDAEEIDDTEEIDDNIKEEQNQVNPDEEKKREDDLWAKFLEGTDTKPKTSLNDKSAASTKPVEKSQEPNKTVTASNNVKEDQKERERRIFEFAGETIVVENNVIKEKIKTTESETAATGSQSVGVSRSRGGLSNVLGQLNKKNKLTTLEKTKLDWDTYKREEDIEDEIVSHNKGKAGFLDRKDFLERTDVRQYEIERNLRMTRRSNR